MKLKSVLYLSIILIVSCVVLYGGSYLIKGYIQRPSTQTNEIILNNVVKEKNPETEKEKQKALQSILYSNPIKMHYFDNFIIEVYPKTLDKPREITTENEDDYQEIGGYEKGNIRSMGKGYGESYERKNFFNLLFLDKDYQQATPLLDRKALILDYKSPASWFNIEMSYNADSTQIKKYIKLQENLKKFSFFLYNIVFEDTNKDGKLTAKDNADYYISDVSGKNLKAVTKNITVINYGLLEDKNSLFFVYFDRSNTEKTHKKKKFALYSLENHTFTPLEEVHKSLQKIEKILIGE